MENTLNYQKILSSEIRKPEHEILTMAFQTGVRQLWIEHVLGRYLKNEISRDNAIESVGIDLVELAKRQHKAMKEDIVWALEE